MKPVVLGLSSILSALPVAAQAQLATREVASALLAAIVPATPDTDARVRALFETAIRAASHPASELLLSEASQLVSDLVPERAHVAWLDRVLAANPHGQTADLARLLQAELLRNLGDLELALAADRRRELPSALWALGPFGDAGDFHHGTVFAPELEFPGPGVKTPGRFGPVEVRRVTRRPLDPWFKLEPVGGPVRAGCYYGLLQVIADAQVSGYVEVTCRGSYQLFVNGERLATVDRHAERTPVQQTLPAGFRAGVNHVVVKTTTNGQAEVMVRCVDARSRALAGLHEFADPEAIRPWSTMAPAPRLEPFQDGLAELEAAAQAITDIESRRLIVLATGLAALRRGDEQRGLRALAALERDSPHTGTDAIGLAKLIEHADALPEDVRRSKAEVLLAAAPQDHHQASLLRARFLAEQDKGEDAARLLETRVAAEAAGPDTFDALHRIYAELRFDALARRTRLRWRQQVPHDPRPTLFEARTRAQALDFAGALALVRETLQHGRTDSLLRAGLDLARQLGDRALSLQLLEQLYAAEPNSSAAALARAKTLLVLGDPGAAAAFAALARHPEATAQQIRLAGDELLRLQHATDAAAAWQRALEFDPGDWVLRRQAARWAGHDELARLAAFVRDGEGLLRAFVPTAREDHAPSTLVLDQMVVQFLPDGSRVERTHTIRRINDLQGVEAYQDAPEAAAADELIALRTIGVDGKSYVPNRVKDAFGMPRLEPGAFVEAIYCNWHRSPAPGPVRGPEFHFQSPHEPYALSELVLVLPPGLPGACRTRNYADPPVTVKLDDGWEAQTFRRADVPRLAQERSPPPLVELVPVVTFGEDQPPEAMARELRTWALTQLRRTPLIEDKAAELTRDCASDLDRTRAIHRFVQQHVADGQGAPDPTAVLLHQRGPRFYLEVALLQAAGVPVRLAATARTRPDLDPNGAPLFRSDLTYPVAAARIEPREAQPIWLFADSPRWFPLGMVPVERQNGAALLLDQDGCEPVRLPLGRPEQATGFWITAEVRLEPEGKATIDATIGFAGSVGYSAAEQLRTLPESQREVAGRQFAGSLLDGWTIQKVDLDHIREPGQPLQARVKATKRRALEAAGDRLLLPLPLPNSDLLEQLGDRAERTLPLRVTDVIAWRWDVTIDAGTDYRIVNVPAPVHVRFPPLEASVVCRMQDQKVRLRQTVLVEPGTIAPSRFQEWIDALRQADLAGTTNLELMSR